MDNRNDNDTRDDAPKAGEDEARGAKVNELETEVIDLRAKFDAATKDAANLSGQLTNVTAERDQAVNQNEVTTSERDAALSEVRHLSDKLEAETNTRQLVEIERDDFAEKLAAAVAERDEARRSRRAAESDAASERSAKQFFQATTAATALTHLFRK